MPKDKTRKSFRPLAKYSMKDRVIIGCVARYLRDIFDDIFYESSYAFRSKPKKSACPTHHDAVENLIKYSMNLKNTTLWVAECDIKKFFDTVHHDVATKAFNKMINNVNKKSIYVDSRVRRLFDSYLNSYTFINNSQKEFNSSKSEDHLSGELPWVREDLEKVYKGKNLDKEKIGIPQGGALSPLIANIVLHDADESVINDNVYDTGQLFYARYCDDMVILHPNKEKCLSAFNRYIKAIEDNHLVIHSPNKIKIYDSSFYSEKSKLPYMWGNPRGSKSIVPWISFLGYQIRYDKLLRIRKSSIEKEKDKQKEIGDKLVELLNVKNSSKKNIHSIMYRYENKLLRMSVGSNDPYKKTGNYCWINGLSLLKKYKNNPSQMKYLDMKRNKQIRRLRKQLQKLKLPKKSTGKSQVKSLSYYGKPLSYSKQFEK